MATSDRDARPSEYGGYPGLIQPAPHVPDAAEIRHLVSQTDPADLESGEDLVARVEPA